MDYRGVLLTCGVLGAGVLALSSGCTGPDPGSLEFAERPGQQGEPQGSSGSSGGTSSSGGTEDAGGDPIFGLTAFEYQDPGVIANEQNPDTHQGNVEGKDCVVAGCHLGGAAPWLFAGTVYSAQNGGTTVAKAEVRIVGPDNAEIGRAYTDPNGNFWMESTGVAIPDGSKVGVRREGGQTPMMMVTPLTNADAGCNANRANCHGTALQGKIYVP